MTSDNLQRTEAAERAAVLHDVGYHVTLDLTGAASSATFRSETVVRFGCREPGSGTFIDLDAASMTAAELNGRALAKDAFSGKRLRLDGLEQANILRVVAECVYQHTGVGLHRFRDPVDGETYLYTQFEPFDAHRVFACFDQPDLKAPFALSVHAPPGWTVVSNGRVTAHDETEGRWRFATTAPVPPYITALVAGPYHSVRDTRVGIDLGVHCRRSLAPHLDSDEILEITEQGFRYFEDIFDYPYPFVDGQGSSRAKYDQLFVPEFNAGAMENAGCVTFSERYIFRSKVTDASRQSRASTILHELAHMWFGNLVTMRWWDDLWLNESFATYMGTRALAEATRFTGAWAEFTNSIKSWAYSQDQLPSTHPIAADVPDIDAVRLNFDGITYAKGASVLRQLVAWVGDGAFTSGLRDYFRRHAFGNAELADFLDALERHADDEYEPRDLGAWSKVWLATAGLNTLRPAFDAQHGRYGDLRLLQEAPEEHPTIRPHRLRVACYRIGEREETVAAQELDVVGPETPLPDLDGREAADLLLINDGDLTYGKVRLDERSFATLLDRLSSIEDALTRSLCWWAGWDMTRDAELPPHAWVDLVINHARAEPDIAVLHSLLAQASIAVNRYTPLGQRDDLRARFTAAARADLESAPAGSDHQLVWARSFIANAHDADEVATVSGLLDGSATVDGLVVDTELRWQIVESLAAAGAADEVVIAAELERDPTDMGSRYAAAARASWPDPAAKEAAWEQLLGDLDLPLAMMRALAQGFQRYGQEEILAGFVDRYVSELERIWDERTPEEAMLLTSALYPTTVIEPATVAAADRALTLPRLPSPGRRLVAEARDQTLRAMRARVAAAPA